MLTKFTVTKIRASISTAAVTAATERSSDVETRLQIAKLQRERNTLNTMKAVTNGASDQQLDQLASERVNISNEVKKFTELLKNGVEEATIDGIQRRSCEMISDDDKNTSQQVKVSGFKM